ncbi:conjugal transfer protein TraN [Halomonas sp. FME65]|uniref:conjugal transfer protein TraN n=1 Tax=Halomonas sp. FME65 TaxID=2742614 RepID=UPI001865F5A1|nr:conjugal transfer protein TraN [Halomonas sp. FME65]
MTPPIRKTVAIGLSLLMVLQPLIVTAQAIPDAPGVDDDLTFEQSSRYGQDLGDWAREFKSDGEELSPDEFFVDESDNANFEGAFPDPDALESAGNSEDAAATLGRNTANAYRSESSDDRSPEAGAFLSAEEQAHRQAPDLSGDPVFNSADDLLNAMENPDQAAALCASGGGGATEQLICDQGASRGTSCDATHAYSAGLIEHISGPHNIATCGEGCVDVWIGQQGDNYRDDQGQNCAIYRNDVSFRILYPEAVTSATLAEIEYDDHLRIHLDTADAANSGEVTDFSGGGYNYTDNLIWQSPHGWNSGWFNDSASCERSSSHTLYPGTNVTSQLQNDVVNFHMINAVGGLGEAYARVRIEYDPSLVIESEGWSSSLCAEQASDSSMNVQCTRMPELNENGCTVAGSVEVCDHHFGAEAQFPGVSPLCEAVKVSAPDTPPDTAGAPACQEALEGRECSLISTECVSAGSDDDDASCNIQRHTYECGGGQGGFDCDLPDILPEAFAECEPEYVVEHTGDDIDYTLSDVRSCHNVLTLDSCDMEREVEILDESGGNSFSEGCFDNRTYTYQPPNAATTIEANVSLTDVTRNYGNTVSIVGWPTRDNDWTTTINAQGERDTYPESASAEYTHSSYYCPEDYSSYGDTCRQQTGTDEDGNPVYTTTPKIENRHYTCSHLSDDVPGHGGYTVDGWSLSGDTCSRSYSTCLTPTPPELSFSVEYDGLYMAQTFEHFPSDEDISYCIVESDDFTSAEWTCTEGGSRSISSPWGTRTIGPDDLAVLDYMYPDDPYQSPHTVSPAVSDGQGRYCWDGHAEYNTATDGNAEMWLGESDAYQDIYGNTQQYENEDIESAELTYNTCGDLEADPQCQFIETRCVEGAAGHEGFCYVESDIYECGEVGSVANSTVREVYDCEGMLNCAGEDCVDIDQESSTTAEFAEAASMLQAVEQMATDMSCTGVDENGVPTGEMDVNCHVFQGDEYQCRRPIGASIHGHDCCDQPADINLGDYLGAVTAMPRLDAAITSMEGGGVSGAVKGSYTSLRDPVMNTFEAVKEPVINAAEGVMGSVNPVTEPVTQFYDDAVSFVKEGVSKLAGDIGAASGTGLAPGGAGAGLSAEGAQATFSEQMLGASGAQALSLLTTAYTVYTMTMLAIQIIWECTEDDFKLAAQRDMKTCVYVGSYCSSETALGLCLTERQSYCCYSSPLARIINEQAQPTFGSAENPQCNGFSVQEFANLDWENIDLSEWIGMLDAHDITPNVDMMAGMDTDENEAMMNEKNPFNHEGNRAAVRERTEQRFNGLDVDDIRRDADDNATLPAW